MRDTWWTPLVRSRHGSRILGSVLIFIVISIWILLPHLRAAEANAAALILAFAMFPDAHVVPGGDIVAFTVTGGQWMGIEIATQNAAALLALPLLMVTAAIV